MSKKILTSGGCDGVCSEDSSPLPQQAPKAHRSDQHEEK
jgi:hypothetical protein